MVYFFLYGQDFKLTYFLQKLKQELQDAGKAWTDLESAKKKDELEIKVHLIIWIIIYLMDSANVNPIWFCRSHSYPAHLLMQIFSKSPSNLSLIGWVAAQHKMAYACVFCLLGIEMLSTWWINVINAEEWRTVQYCTLQCIYPPNKSKLFLSRRNEEIALFFSFRFVCPEFNSIR